MKVTPAIGALFQSQRNLRLYWMIPGNVLPAIFLWVLAIFVSPLVFLIVLSLRLPGIYSDESPRMGASVPVAAMLPPLSALRAAWPPLPDSPSLSELQNLLHRHPHFLSYQDSKSLPIARSEDSDSIAHLFPIRLDRFKLRFWKHA